jgi:hypothetical protein
MIPQICGGDSINGAGTSKEDVIMFPDFVGGWDNLITYRTYAACLFEDFGQVVTPLLLL